MQRTLVLAGKKPKEIVLRVDGTVLEQTANGKTTKKSFANEHEARIAFDKAIRTRLRADYVYLADAEPGEIRLEAFAPGAGSGGVLDMSLDGKLLATATLTGRGNGFGAKLEIIEVDTGARRVIVDEPTGNGQAFVHALLFDRTANGLYFLMRDDTEYVDLANGIRRVVARGRGFNPHVVRPSFDRERKRLLVFGDGLVVRVLDERERAVIEVPTKHATTECRAAGISPSGNLLAVHIISRGLVYNHADAHGDATNEVRIYDLESGKLWETVELRTKISRVGFTPTDDTLVVIEDYANGPIGLAIPSGDERWRITDGNGIARAHDWAYSPDGKRLAITGRPVRLIELASGKDVALEATTEYGDGKRVVFSADGRRLASVYSGTAYVHQL